LTLILCQAVTRTKPVSTARSPAASGEPDRRLWLPVDVQLKHIRPRVVADRVRGGLGDGGFVLAFFQQQRDRLEELIVQMGLETVRSSKAYVLSGGERRRLEIARSLTLSPSFMLLDEPFSGIDPLTVKDLQETIRDLSRSGIGILITDHNVRETLNVTDRAYIVNHGKIMAQGTPEALSNDAEVRRVYLGDHFRLN